MTYTVRPISDRTAFTGKHDHGRFDTAWWITEELLLSEVAKLGGKNLVLELDATDRDIRLDGRLRANARLASPAVRIAFDSKHGPLTYATDRFMTWKDNVRAIALGLEALRKVDRYGISKRGEQYTGYRAIGAGSGATAMGGMTHDQALAVVAGLTDREVAKDLKSAYRSAQANAHPDRRGGDRTAWDQLERAAKALGLLS